MDHIYLVQHLFSGRLRPCSSQERNGTTTRNVETTELRHADLVGIAAGTLAVTNPNDVELSALGRALRSGPRRRIGNGHSLRQ